jgi:hypothetical protein
MLWNTTFFICYGCSYNLKHALHTYTCKTPLVVVYVYIIIFEQPYIVTPTTIPNVFITTLNVFLESAILWILKIHNISCLWWMKTCTFTPIQM